MVCASGPRTPHEQSNGPSTNNKHKIPSIQLILLIASVAQQMRARSGLAKAAGAVRPAAGYHQLRSCGKPPVGARHVEQARKAARRVNQGMKNSEARLEAERNGASRIGFGGSVGGQI